MENKPEPSQFRDPGFWIVVFLLIVALVAIYFSITSEMTPSATPITVTAPISTQTPTASAIDPEPYRGAEWNPTPYRPHVENLCAPTNVYGRADNSGIVLYVLPKNSYVVPRETFKGYTMIQPAHWIETSSICK